MAFRRLGTCLKAGFAKAVWSDDSIVRYKGMAQQSVGVSARDICFVTYVNGCRDLILIRTKLLPEILSTDLEYLLHGFKGVPIGLAESVCIHIVAAKDPLVDGLQCVVSVPVLAEHLTTLLTLRRYRARQIIACV